MKEIRWHENSCPIDTDNTQTRYDCHTGPYQTTQHRKCPSPWQQNHINQMHHTLHAYTMNLLSPPWTQPQNPPLTKPRGTRDRNINGYEGREMCTTCNETESMSHIITQYNKRNTWLIWQLEKALWPHWNIPWPEIMLGTVLGCSNITLQPERLGRHNQQQQWKTMHWGPTRLFQIILSESVYLI